MVDELKNPNKVMVEIPKQVIKVEDLKVQHKVNTTKRNIVDKVNDKSVENRTKGYN